MNLKIKMSYLYSYPLVSIELTFLVPNMFWTSASLNFVFQGKYITKQDTAFRPKVIVHIHVNFKM